MTTITTHDPAGGGNPRLLFSVGEHRDPKFPTPLDFPLQRGVNTIGSDPGNDLCLVGLARFHAQIHRDEADDYVLTSVAGSARVHGRPVTAAELHSGARIELGSWVLSYARAESADHGRPDGGRQGGELSAGPRVGA
jgi:hypothetical protein